MSYPFMDPNSRNFLATGYGPMMGMGSYSGGFGMGNPFGGGGYYGGYQQPNFWQMAPSIYQMASGGATPAFSFGQGMQGGSPWDLIFGGAVSGMQIGGMVQNYNNYGAGSLVSSGLGLLGMFGNYRQGAIYQDQAPNRELQSVSQQLEQVNNMLMNSQSLPEYRSYMQAATTIENTTKGITEKQGKLSELRTQSGTSKDPSLQGRIQMLEGDIKMANENLVIQRQILADTKKIFEDKRALLIKTREELVAKRNTLFEQVRAKGLNQTG